MDWDGSTAMDDVLPSMLEDNEEVPLRQYYFPLCFRACASARSVSPSVLRPIVLIPGRPPQDPDELQSAEMDEVQHPLQSISLDHVRVLRCLSVSVCLRLSLIVHATLCAVHRPRYG